MKKTILALLIIVVGVGVYLYTSEESPTVNTQVPTTEDQTFRPDPSSASFTFDDTKVTLISGRATIAASEENIFAEEVGLLDETAYGDLNGDSKNDAALLLSRSGGGSGTFIYLGAYVSGTVNYKGSNVIFLGDRIAPKSIDITSGVVTVTYLDRRSDEPFAAEPTVEVSKKFIFRNNELVER